MDTVQDYTVTIDNMTIAVYELCPLCKPVLTVVLLHTLHTTRDTWLDIGTMNEIQQQGHRAIAVDLPGSGNSTGSSSMIRNKGRFMVQLFTKLSIQNRPVIVSPTISAKYALPLVFNSPKPLVRAWVALEAPGMGAYSADNFNNLDIPLLAVYGEKDIKTRPVVEELMVKVPDLRSTIIRGGGVESFTENSAQWHRALRNFLRRVSSSIHTQYECHIRSETVTYAPRLSHTQ